MPGLRYMLLFAALVLGGCNPDADERETPGNAAAPAEKNEVTVERPQAVPTLAPEMDRAGLLGAVTQAASAHAAGKDDRAAQAELAGRRFVVKLRFGCGGPVGEGPLNWGYDEEEQRLMVRATPDIEGTAAGVEASPEEPIEAVEGFWIPRPWLLSDDCPAETSAGAAAPPPPTVGIAHYFTADDSRVSRRSRRSYEIVRRAEPAILPPSGGFNLVLEGRLKPWPQAGVIRCRGAGDTRPICIVSAEFDRVSFENPDTGQIVAQWGAG